jgi:peptidoglycan/LPS O-acetylase OafA/YrhL
VSATTPRAGSGIHGRLDALTGIRGIAALWVVAYHYAIIPFDALPWGRVLPFVKFGYLGVDLFFFLSGFIIAYTHARDTATLAPRRVLHFWGLRFARIYPVHAAVLLAMVLMALAGPLLHVMPHHPENFYWRDLVWNMLLMQSWGVSPTVNWNFPSWSISSEWAAYLLFPLLALALARIATRRQAVLWLLAETALFALAYVFFFHGSLDLKFDEGGFARFAVMRIAFEFPAGALAWKLMTLHDVRRWPWTALIAAALGVAYVFAGTAARDLLVVLACFLAVLAGAVSDTLVARVLGLAPIVWLGEVSYSIYMVHAPIRMTAGKAAGLLVARVGTGALGWLVALLLFALTIGVAALVHALIEEPGRHALRHWFDRWLRATRKTPLPPAPAIAEEAAG